MDDVAEMFAAGRVLEADVVVELADRGEQFPDVVVIFEDGVFDVHA